MYISYKLIIMRLYIKGTHTFIFEFVKKFVKFQIPRPVRYFLGTQCMYDFIISTILIPRSIELI